MLPMYDVKSTINSHWNQIEKIFKSQAFQQAGLASADDIIIILTQFIIAKYRATITGNNKHYIRLFFDTVGNDSLADMDGARFLEIMEAIDLDQLDKSDNVYKFASSAKIAMKKIANNEAITPDILKEFDEIFNSPSKTETEEQTEEQKKANEMTEGADIFDDSDKEDKEEEPKVNTTTPSADVEIIEQTEEETEGQNVESIAQQIEHSSTLDEVD